MRSLDAAVARSYHGHTRSTSLVKAIVKGAAVQPAPSLFNTLIV